MLKFYFRATIHGAKKVNDSLGFLWKGFALDESSNAFTQIQVSD